MSVGYFLQVRSHILIVSQWLFCENFSWLLCSRFEPTLFRHHHELRGLYQPRLHHLSPWLALSPLGNHALFIELQRMSRSVKVIGCIKVNQGHTNFIKAMLVPISLDQGQGIIPYLLRACKVIQPWSRSTPCQESLMKVRQVYTRLGWIIACVLPAIVDFGSENEMLNAQIYISICCCVW